MKEESFQHHVSTALRKLPESSAERSVKLYEHGSLLVKMYAPRKHDPQTPHTRDELYVVVSGYGKFYNGRTRVPFEPGDFIFVSAGTIHRFEDFTDDFAVWVAYFGPEGGERT